MASAPFGEACADADHLGLGREQGAQPIPVGGLDGVEVSKRDIRWVSGRHESPSPFSSSAVTLSDLALLESWAKTTPGVPASRPTKSKHGWRSTSRGYSRPVCFEQIRGGHSNLHLCRNRRRRTTPCARRPPLGQPLPGAHDMAREYGRISSLWSICGPGAPSLGVLRRPRRNRCRILRHELRGGICPCTTRRSPRAVYGRARDIARVLALAEVLSALTKSTSMRSASGDLGKREDYVGRQLRRWFRQYDESRSVSLPLVDELYEALLSARPSQPKATVVHGDYRLGNCLTDNRGEIVRRPGLGDLHSRRSAGRSRVHARHMGRAGRRPPRGGALALDCSRLCNPGGTARALRVGQWPGPLPGSASTWRSITGRAPASTRGSTPAISRAEVTRRRRR